MALSLRSVTKDDLERIFNWRNELSVRQNMYSTAEISMEDHIAYWEKHLKISNEYSYIVVVGKMDIGVARLIPSESWHQVDIYLTETAGGMGIGEQAIAELVKKAKEKELKTLFAKVKVDNIPSQKIFEENGFIKRTKISCTKDTKEGFNYYELEVSK